MNTAGDAHRLGRQKIDDACDKVESQLGTGERLDLTNAFSQVGRPLWPELAIEIVRVVRELRPDWQDVEFFAHVSLTGPDAQVHRELLLAAYQQSTLVGDTTRDNGDLGMLEILSETPMQIDRFVVKGLVGRGGFGRVFRAYDPKLTRDVVIKLRRPDKGDTLGAGHGLVAESQKAASLQHAGIVSVHEVGEYKGLPYAVQAYIPGGNLKARLPSLSRRASVGILVQVLEAVGFAHEKRILHRDLKPENILLDEHGNGLVADFGLAISETEQIGAEGQFAGTPEYMSPEQVRKESHRLTASSDIWSLGVILYQILTGVVPFKKTGDSEQLIDMILNQEAVAPRSVNSEVPAELERICLKCLTKDSRQRYTNAQQMSAELSAWLEADSRDAVSPISPSGPESRVRVVPKGLVAFDKNDNGFFWDLLPGQRRSGGVPEAVGFWTDWVEQAEGPSSFVGLIYGPSGCGKSSLVRAGVLPCLGDHVTSILVEATDKDTEVRLLHELRQQFPAIPTKLSLPEIFRGLREGQWNLRGQKIVVVLDQFEQWLHVHGAHSDSQLVSAIRHCDGVALQTLVLARDDFWMAISRFFGQLEIPLVQNANFRAVDRFDIPHAEFVLSSLGQAYGRLSDGALTESETDFVQAAVERLAVENQVICVQLVLFAETIKAQVWDLATLERLGDTSEIGALFLEQCISSESANPLFRSREKGIRRILAALMPATGTVIKGGLRSKQELADAVDLDISSEEFTSLLDILDRQLRIISPADLDASGAEVQSARSVDPSKWGQAAEEELTSSQSKSRERYFQLTHDFLVESIRIWLERKDRETPAGRARLRLRQLSEDWKHTQDTRSVPTMSEYVAIARHVRPRTCNQAERGLYRAATKRHVGRLVAFCLVGVALIAVALWNRNQQRRDLALANVEQLLAAEPAALQVVIGNLERDKSYSCAAIRDRLAGPNVESNAELRLLVALATLGCATDDAIESIVRLADQIPIAQVAFLIPALNTNRSTAIEYLKQRSDVEPPGDLKGALALLIFHLGDERTLLDFSDDFDDTHGAVYSSHVMEYFSGRAADYLNLLSKYATDVSQHDRLANILNGVSCFELNRLSDDQRKQLGGLCRGFFLRSPSGFMHSASETVLIRLGADVPSHLLPLGEPVDGRGWMVDQLGQTFTRIDPSGMKLKVGAAGAVMLSEEVAEHPFWLATQETTNSLFLEFANSLDAASVFEEPYEPHRGFLLTKEQLSKIAKQPPALVSLASVMDKPATAMNLAACQAFCNWLSRRSAFDLAYEPAPSESNPQKMRRVDNLGYRLPSPFEWSLATFSERFDVLPYSREEIISKYGDLNVDPYTYRSLHSPKTLLPNRWGVYDLLGNAAECTLASQRIIFVDWKLADTTGGVSASVRHAAPRLGALDSGFRVARTARPF